MRAIASGSSCQSRPQESRRAASFTTAVTVVSLTGFGALAAALGFAAPARAGFVAGAGFRTVAVEVDGALEGIFTERDLLRAVAEGADLDTEPISTWMTEYPDSFHPEMDVEEAAEWMLATGFRHLPVVDGGDVVGVISIKDVLWALTDEER